MQIHWRRHGLSNARTLFQPAARVFALGALLLGGIVACDQVASPELTRSENTAATGDIGGVVQDLSGAAVAGASVRTPGGAEAITDAAGRFRITGLAVTDRLPVTVRAPRYARTTAIYRVRSGVELRRPIHVQPEAPPVVINAAAGGTVPFQGGGEIVFPPDAFEGVTEGEPVSIRATYIDPENAEQFSTAPGDFTGRSLSGEEVVLESFGMNTVEATGAQGQPVDLRPGQQALIRFPVRGGTGGPTLPLWSFDEQTGQWVEQGAATVTPSFIDARVNTLAPQYNLDKPFQPICIEIEVLRTDKITPRPNHWVTATALSYAGAGGDWTNGAGLVQFQVLSASQLLIQAGTASQTVATPPAGTPGCPRLATLVF